MTRDYIRQKTCIVIRKNGDYLQGYILYSDDLRWSESPYHAWKTRNIEKARKVARRTGGIMVLFNPIINETKVIGT